jgi:ubiquinone/menaquinone biosynthesis C-methylase UbiE/glycosyltransferase involved in cell wall biosynthesis
MTEKQPSHPLTAGEFHGRMAGDWERKYEERASFRARERILLGMLRRSCRPGSVWLDAGCGTGRFSRRLAEMGAGRVVGLDAAPQMLEVAARLAATAGLSSRVTFSRCEELSRIPEKEQAFDGILCSSVLEYLDKPEAVLQEFNRLLKPGGFLVVSLPNRAAWLRRAQNVCFRISSRLLQYAWPVYLRLVRHQYVGSEACRMLQTAGFQVVGIHYGGSGIKGINLDPFAFWGPLMFLESVKQERDERPVLLVVVRTFFPAFKAGGPIQSLQALVRRLSGAFRIKVLTRDRDSGESRAFAGIRSNTWTPVSGAEVMYLPPRATTIRNLIRLINRSEYDLLYINSFFDPVFTLAPLLARRLGFLYKRPVVLAPRGELSGGALAQKRIKKWLFLRAMRGFGLYRDVRWHASCEEERREIMEAFRGDQDIAKKIEVARNLAITPTENIGRLPRSAKKTGVLRAVFISRISPKKNLAKAIDLLSRVRGDVSLDVFGYISDPDYWAQCQAHASRSTPLRMTYQGVVPHEEVVPRLQAYDLFVFPTLGENFGHVILEALLAGCPVAVSSVTPWQILEEEEAGWVIPLEQEERYVKTLQQVADMEEAAHAVWRAGARRAGLAALNDEQVVADNLRLFQEAVRAGGLGLEGRDRA